MEEDCRQKEEERVTLELELTEVKENLKKALSGGVSLGLTIQPKSGSSGLQVRKRPVTILFYDSCPHHFISLVCLCVFSHLRCCGGPKSLRLSPAVTLATQSLARCRSTAPHCSAGIPQIKSLPQSEDTS